MKDGIELEVIDALQYVNIFLWVWDATILLLHAAILGDGPDRLLVGAAAC